MVRLFYLGDQVRHVRGLREWRRVQRPLPAMCPGAHSRWCVCRRQDRTNGWLYANSSDGIHWEKPSLGVYDLAKGAEGKKPGYAAHGTKNNIVLGNSDGVGITLDTHEKDPAKKFKLFGSGDIDGAKISGVATSPDGIHWANARE